eukprot:TRINITY_DN2117_c0_g1_i1.p1 TRINITY_DN2117_c0_g1~~TRINITY_DN2117_c0_g1_i1.p1  ORF type:complete len:207 (-),score=52.72 TRINITY_DN2117_c0_g1_i1:143-763(-)
MEFSSERLVYKSFDMSHSSEGYKEILASKNVCKYFYLGEERGFTSDECVSVYGRVGGQWEKYGFGQWSVFEKESNKMIGYCGFRAKNKYIDENENVGNGNNDEENNDDGHSIFIEILYGIHEDYWGKKYATESVKSTLDYFIDNQLEEINNNNILGETITYITAAVHVDNHISKKILIKNGFVLQNNQTPPYCDPKYNDEYYILGI